MLADEIDTKTPVIGIRILICSTGQLLEFSKREIVIGRVQDCDMVLKQLYLSCWHVMVCKQFDDEYVIEDLNIANSTFITATNERIQPGQKAILRKGEIIQLGSIKLRLY